MFKFITRRHLIINIIVGLALAIGLFALSLYSLGWITGHGKAATVPSVTGKKLEEARAILKKAGFDMEVQDSVYVDSLPPLAITRQFPEEDEIVKTNRTVFLVVNRKDPPIIEMPNLLGYSFRNAEMVLKGLDLRLGDTTFKPDFAKNAILEQLYNGGSIAPGTKIRKGSIISLVMGDGVGTKEFAVPTIINMTYCDAKQLMSQNGIVFGSIVLNPDVTDTCNAFIYKQNPARFDDDKRMLMMRTGQTIDVWLQKGRIVVDSTLTKEPE